MGPSAILQSARQRRREVLRRRLWRVLFSTEQARLGTFFLDPSDHIGRERLISGDVYEAAQIEAMGRLCAALGLGDGLAMDVGANIGNHACWMARTFGHVVCIEPGEIAALVLRANLLATGRRNWDVVQAALGSQSDRGRLVAQGAGNLGSSRMEAAGDSGEGVEVKRGDDLLRELERASKVDLIKIDVEGRELEVLSGLAETLETWKPLVCVEALEEHPWRQVRDYLAAHGYRHFRVCHPDAPDRGLAWRIGSLFRGLAWELVPLHEEFRRGGYELIFCSTVPLGPEA